MKIYKYPRIQTPNDARAPLRFTSPGVFAHFGIWVFACLGLCLLLGCGPRRPATIPVSGTVTFDGGRPPAEGAIYFAPIAVAEGSSMRPGRAKFDANGRFNAGSYEEGDGLLPGTYRVRIECWHVAPTMESPGLSYVADDFTPDDVVVGSKRVTLNLDVPRAK